MSRFSPIIAILLLVALVLGGYFLWWPKYQEFEGKRLELEGKDREIKQKEEYLSKLEGLFAQLAEYSDELNKIDLALPTNPSVAALFNFFQKTSSENGLILTNIGLGGLYSLKPGQERIQEMPFDVSLSGSYSAFKNFLSAIYRNARLIEVKSISFSSLEEGKDLFAFDLSLKTHAYQELEAEEGEPPELE